MSPLSTVATPVATSTTWRRALVAAAAAAAAAIATAAAAIATAAASATHITVTLPHLLRGHAPLLSLAHLQDAPLELHAVELVDEKLGVPEGGARARGIGN